MKLFVSDTELARIKQEAIEAYTKERADEKEARRQLVIEADRTRGECVVGFNLRDPNIVVFSIERVVMGDPQNERTIVGYYLKADADSLKDGGKIQGDKFTREWSLYCSREAHNELVKLFAGVEALPKTKPGIIKG